MSERECLIKLLFIILLEYKLMIAYLYKRVINTQNIYDQRDTPAFKKKSNKYN